MIARSLPRPDYAGGVSGQVHLQASALTSLGHDVTVYALNPPSAPVPYRYCTVSLPAPIARGHIARLFAFPLAVARLALDGYDIVHTHGDDHLLRVRRPIVRTFYGSSRAEALAATNVRHRLYHSSMAFLERLSERRATEVAIISSSTQRYLRRRAVVIPCAIDPRVFYPSGEKSDVPSILFVGDLGTRKRAGLLLDAFARDVRPSVPGAELWMVTTDTVAAPGVRWMGRVSAPDLVRLYRKAWVLCLPSRYEGFGVPYIEAMACGTPVVATPNGSAEEILEAGRWGCLVGEGEIGWALVDLLASADRRRHLVQQGLERARGYGIDRIAEQYEAVYAQVLSGFARAPEGGVRQ